MAQADIFPLTPYWPITRQLVSLKVRRRMYSGKQYVRSYGTDLNLLELKGVGPAADLTTLQNFYEQQAKDVFTFPDKSFTPQVNRVVVFAAAPEWEEQGYQQFVWHCVLIETAGA
jgi:hypothetical protein